MNNASSCTYSSLGRCNCLYCASRGRPADNRINRYEYGTYDRWADHGYNGERYETPRAVSQYDVNKLQSEISDLREQVRTLNILVEKLIGVFCPEEKSR